MTSGCRRRLLGKTKAAGSGGLSDLVVERRGVRTSERKKKRGEEKKREAQAIKNRNRRDDAQKRGFWDLVRRKKIKKIKSKKRMHGRPSPAKKTDPQQRLT